MRSAQFGLRNLAVLFLVIPLGMALLFWALGINSSNAETTATPAESVAAWEKIATVVEHPRCLNCHQV
jgi:hypothetical protein